MEKNTPPSHVLSMEKNVLATFEEFSHYIEFFVKTSDHPIPIHPWHGRRAATSARRAGACDHLIAAALVHDFSVRAGHGLAVDCGVNSAALLSCIFPIEVLRPLRLLDKIPESWKLGDQHPLRAQGAEQAYRLFQFIRMAHVRPEENLIGLESLLRIARRASLDC